jgi:chromate transporter
LKIAAVAVVANAVWSMGRRMCPDPIRASLAAGAAIVTLLWPTAGAQVAAIVLGGVAGWFLFRDAADSEETATSVSHGGSHRIAVLALVVFAALLVFLPIVAHTTGSTAWAVGDTFYRAGSLVFGGGHVVLPLLKAGVVTPGWVTEETFLAGYGAAQAVPGPLFTFAAYLGAAMDAGPSGIAGAALCVGAIFLPGWLLVGGAAPYWESWRQLPAAQALLRGTNAAVVGILLAALYDPVWQTGITGPRELAVALAAFAFLAWWRTPAWILVIGCTVAGAVFL